MRLTEHGGVTVGLGFIVLVGLIGGHDDRTDANDLKNPSDLEPAP